MSRLKEELEQTKGEKAEMEKTLREAAQKQRGLLEQAETRATSAQEELNALKAKCDAWLAELALINREMDSEFLEFFFSVPLLISASVICRHTT